MIEKEEANFMSPVVTQIQTNESQDSEIVSSAMTQSKMGDIKKSILTKIGWTYHPMLIPRAKTN